MEVWVYSFDAKQGDVSETVLDINPPEDTSSCIDIIAEKPIFQGKILLRIYIPLIDVTLNLHHEVDYDVKDSEKRHFNRFLYTLDKREEMESNRLERLKECHYWSRETGRCFILNIPKEQRNKDPYKLNLTELQVRLIKKLSRYFGEKTVVEAIRTYKHERTFDSRSLTNYMKKILRAVKTSKGK